jgi:spore maturation protein CgeB
LKILLAGPLENPISNVHFIRQTFTRLGHDVQAFDYRAVVKEKGPDAMHRKLLAAVESFKPDVLFLVKGERVDPAVIREISGKTHVALHYMDSPIHGWLKALGRECDSFWVTTGGLVEKYRKLGFNNVHHMWEGVDPKVHRHIEEEAPEYKCQVAFMGTNKAGRERLLREVMKAGFELKIWGTRWPVDMPVAGEFIGEDDFARACFNADIVLGLNDNNRIPDYFSLRTALTLASRGFHITSHVPGLENWFVNGTHLAWFRVKKKSLPPWRTDYSDCVRVIRYYLDKPQQRRRIALEGQKHVYTYFTWEYQLGKVIEKLQDILATEAQRHRELTGNI